MEEKYEVTIKIYGISSHNVTYYAQVDAIIDKIRYAGIDSNSKKFLYIWTRYIYDNNENIIRTDQMPTFKNLFKPEMVVLNQDWNVKYGVEIIE